jgi:hypothetical protein
MATPAVTAVCVLAMVSPAGVVLAMMILGRNFENQAMGCLCGSGDRHQGRRQDGSKKYEEDVPRASGARHAGATLLHRFSPPTAAPDRRH